MRGNIKASGGEFQRLQMVGLLKSLQRLSREIDSINQSSWSRHGEEWANLNLLSSAEIPAKQAGMFSCDFSSPFYRGKACCICQIQLYRNVKKGDCSSGQMKWMIMWLKSFRSPIELSSGFRSQFHLPLSLLTTSSNSFSIHRFHLHNNQSL